MDNTHVKPAELVIHLFGGIRKLARALGRDPAAICRWKKHGTVPTSVQRRLLEIAWDRGIQLTAHELIFGRKRAWKEWDFDYECSLIKDEDMGLGDHTK